MLENVQENAYKLLSSSRFWMILLVILFFIVIAVYVYGKYVTPLVEPKFVANKEFTDKSDDDGDDGGKGEVEIIILQ